MKAEFLSKIIPVNFELGFLEAHFKDAEVLFDLSFDEMNFTENIFYKNKIVFANAVASSCKDLPKNYVRINGWNGFLQRDVLEIACENEMSIAAINILNELNWKYQICADDPGMVSARIISMIINEAYFTLQDEVSSKDEIDIAMKLGTNYPFGPFEWSEKIGLEKIYFLLKKLSETNSRYQISPALINEINN